MGKNKKNKTSEIITLSKNGFSVNSCYVCSITSCHVVSKVQVSLLLKTYENCQNDLFKYFISTNIRIFGVDVMAPRRSFDERFCRRHD